MSGEYDRRLQLLNRMKQLAEARAMGFLAARSGHVLPLEQFSIRWRVAYKQSFASGKKCLEADKKRRRK